VVTQPRRTLAPTVLHITEALGGGIVTALRELPSAAPSYRHLLLAAPRTGHGTGTDLEEVFDGVRLSEPGPRGLARAIRSAARDLRPDILHLHSSWAGMLGRVLLPRATGHVVYTPHCFDFERCDRPPPMKAAVLLAERVLARRCRVVAACGPRERVLAERLGARAIYVPNVVTAAVPPWRPRPRPRPLVLTIGRVEPQKDPDFLLSVVALSRRKGHDWDFLWVGGGSTEAESRLRSAGVRVTGWQPRNACLQLLAECDAYVHTAAWEGNPMTLLEAQAGGAPIVVRSVPSTIALGHPPDLATPAAFCDGLERVLLGDRLPSPSLATKEDQRRALERCYDLALRSPASGEVQLS
jgi:glycosyltransferase involved in cell wall biosynthesis